MTESKSTVTDHKAEHEGHATHDLHEYAGGYITAHEGVLPVWLLFVYFGLFSWACYYIVTYWGGVGPGRIG
jgi:hypothetical protein